MTKHALQYKILDLLLLKNRGGGNKTKAICHNAHLMRTDKTISLIYGMSTGNQQTMATIHRNGSIRVYHRYANVGNKIWAWRMQKFFDLLNVHTIGNDNYFSKLTISEGYQNNISLVSAAELPQRDLTAQEAKALAEYEALPMHERWGKRTPYLRLRYGPDYWYGVITDYRLPAAHTPAPCFIIRPMPGKTTGGYYFDLSPTQAGDSGFTVLKGHRRMKFYKCVSPSGGTTFSKYQWSMPTTDEATGETTPGDWLTIEGNLEFCRKGIHICTLDQICCWMNDFANLVVEMEYEGKVLTGSNNDNKYLVRKARIKRIVADTTDFQKQFGSHSRSSAAQRALKALTQGKQLKQPEVYKIDVRVTHIVSTTATVYSKAELARVRKQAVTEARRWSAYSSNFGTTSQTCQTCSSKTTLLPQ